MNKLIKMLFYSFVVMIFILNNTALSQLKNLILKMEMNKEKYLTSEPVFANVYLLNSGNSSVNTRKPHFGDGYFDVIIKDDKGKVFPYAYVRNNVRDSTLSLKLDGGDTFYEVLDLLEYYAPGKRPLRQIHSKTFFELGSYTAQAVLESGYGKIYSEIINFSVEEPQGFEREAYDLLVRATNFEGLNMQQAANILDTLIQKFPESSYHVLAFIQKMRMYEWSNKLDEQTIGYNAALSLIQAHPTSEAADLALTHILVRAQQVVKTPEERKHLLQKIAQEHPGTKIGERAKKALKKYDSN